ncbi:uncharacterized protein [Acropora muricata]|uniref:uncharacterized protein n=1 Tax=Acropora muricata TaxID=159855 RepID=UPI0034E41570
MPERGTCFHGRGNATKIGRGLRSAKTATPTTALWLAIGLAKAKGANPDQKLECSPIGSQVLFSTTFLAAIAIDLLPDTAVINNELLRLRIDIAGLQETRLAESGCLKESDYTFFWHGKKEEEVREYGVVFAVINSLLDKVQLGDTAPDDIKDSFYNQLETTTKDYQKQEALIILGDFNARVGDDYEAWPNCLGHFGVGKCNDNGQRLLELCPYHELCITNTFLSTKPHHRESWRHPRSKQWHQLDLILARRPFLKNFLVTRSYHSADCDTDPSIVCSKLRLEPRKFHHTKQVQRPKIDVTKTRHPDLSINFEKLFSSTFLEDYAATSTEQWDNLKSTMYSTALQAFGKKRGGQRKDWYESNSARLDPLIASKRKALQVYKDKPSAASLQALRSARSNVQREVRLCINEY